MSLPTTLLAVLLAPVVLAAPRTTPSLSLAEFARVILDANLPPSADREALVERLEGALTSHPESPLAAELVTEWRRLADRPDAPRTAQKRLLEFARKELPLHGNARMLLREILSEQAERRGEFEEAQKLDPAAEFVTHYLAVGPFGDEGDTYHEFPCPPELEGLRIGGEYRGRFGPVTWRELRRQPDNRGVQLAPSAPRGHTDGAHYGLVQVRSESSRPAFVEISCYGPYELWWNGERIASVDRIRVRPPVRTYFASPLRAGWNRLLVKTSSARSSRVSLRFVDARAVTIDGLVEETGLELHETAKSAAPISEGYEDETAWLIRHCSAENGAETPERPILLALLGRTLMHNSEPDEGLHHCREAYKLAPDDAAIAATYFEAIRSARHLPPSLQRNEERGFLQSHADLVDAHWHLSWRAIERLVADDQAEQALRRVEAILADNPSDYRALRQKETILEQLDWDGMAAEVFDRIVEHYGNDPEVRAEHARKIAQRGDPMRALALVRKGLETLPGDRRLLSAAASFAEDAGLVRDAMAFRDRLDRRTADAPEALERRALRAREQRDLAKAAELFAELCRVRPLDARAWEDLGDTRLLLGENEAAIAAWKASLRLDPSAHQLRARICHHEGREPHVETQRFQLDALAEVARYESRPEDDGAPSTLVLDQMLIRVYEDGSQMEETHQLRRINDRRGIELFEESQHAAEAEELLEIRTILPDGSIHRPHYVGGFSMPRLEPGAFIEEHYRNYKQAPGVRPIDFVTFFFANSDEPFRYSRLVVILPKEHELGEFLLRNFAREDMSREELGDLQAYVFLKRNMARMPTEPRMPPVQEVAPWVSFGKRPGAAAFVRDRRASFASITRPWREIRAKADEIAAELGEDAQSELAKARAVHRFVHEHVASPQGYGGALPLEALLEGQGDRFALQLALLEALDVPWTPALIDTSNAAAVPSADPAWNAPFNYTHRAARIRPRDGDAYWLVQGTPRHWPFAKLPDMAGDANIGGAPYLLLEGAYGVPGRMPAPSTEDAGVHFEAHLRLRGRDATMQVRLELRGVQGYGLAEILRMQDKNTHRLIGQNLTGRFFRGWTLRGLEVPSLEQKGRPAVLELELERRGIAREHEDELRLPALALPSSMMQRFATRAEREYPFVAEELDLASYHLVIETGARRCIELPDGLLRRKLLLDYSLSWTQTDQTLELRQSRILRPGRIPAERFGEWLELCGEIDRAENAGLRLR